MLPTATVPAVVITTPGQGVATVLAGHEHPEPVQVGDRLWHQEGYAALVTAIDPVTLAVYAEARYGRRDAGTVTIADGEWMRAHACDFCDRYPTRQAGGVFGTLLCEPHAREHYGVDWRTETGEIGVKVIAGLYAEI